jgi:hypothetical protein
LIPRQLIEFTGIKGGWEFFSKGKERQVGGIQGFNASVSALRVP